MSPYDLSPYIFVTMIICHHSSPVTKCRCHQNFVTECRVTKKMSPYVLDPRGSEVEKNYENVETEEISHANEHEGRGIIPPL